MSSKKNKSTPPPKRPGPIVVGSPLHRVLEIIASRIAERLRKPHEDDTKPKVNGTE